MTTRKTLSRAVRVIGAWLLIMGTLAGCTYTELDRADGYYDTPEPEAPAVYTSGEFGELTEYGTWIHSAPFGWVWQPYVDDGWQPYYHGHWAWSQWGWTWISYEPFGWAAYHYGHWVFDPIWAWIWIPGYEWYPSRVQWVVYDDYICWAPLGPPGYLIGDPWASPIDDLWIVVEPGYFTHPHVGRYTKRRYRWKTTSSTLTRVLRNAPDVRYVSRHRGKSVRKVDIKMTRIKVGSKEIRKMKLPEEHRKTVDRYKTKTRRKKVERKDDYRKPERKERKEKKEKIKKAPRRGKSSGKSKSSVRKGSTKKQEKVKDKEKDRKSKSGSSKKKKKKRP